MSACNNTLSWSYTTGGPF